MIKLILTEGKDEDIIEIAEHYGKDSQLCMLMEECGELIQAANKRLRDPDNFQRKRDLINEMADVLVMIEQVAALDKIGPGNVTRAMEYKKQRQKERMRR